jgi:quercetin dioxygenase-like cupin family protein
MIEIDLHIKHHFFPDLYAKEMHLLAGQFGISHRHEFDHISMLATGRASVEVDGVTTEYTAPAFIMVRAGKEHRFVALEDITWFCVHETDETDEAKIDASLIEKEPA